MENRLSLIMYYLKINKMFEVFLEIDIVYF